jgi:hypothetical protein
MSSGVDAVSRVVKLYAATGKALLRGLARGDLSRHSFWATAETLRGLPREATCPSKSSNAGRSWKAFYVASHVRPKAFYVVTRMAKWEIRFQRFALSFRPSAKVLMRSPPREAEGLLRGYAARGNEKFHLSPACQAGHAL